MGKDFSRSTGIPNNPKQAVNAFFHSDTRKIDMGVIEFYDPYTGTRRKRLFPLFSGLGTSSKVCERITRHNYIKRLGAKLSYLITSLSCLISDPRYDTKICIDAETLVHGRMNAAFVCNSKYMGASRCCAPDAKMDDGLLNIVSLHNFNLLESCLLTPKVYVRIPKKSTQ